MSAQLEDGYTRTANELMERLMKIKLNGTQHNIVYCIIRNTYGFQRKSHPMSLSFISTAIETHKDLIKRELDKLIESKIVRVFKEATFNDPREIGMNKNVSDWKVDSKPISRQSTKQSTVSESVYPQSPNQSSPSVDQLVYQERKVFKENLKDNSTTTADVYESVGDIHLKVFKTISMSGLMIGLVKKIKDKGHSDEFLKELMLEAGESAGGVPNIRFIETIYQSWDEKNINSREESKEDKSKRTSNVRHFSKGNPNVKPKLAIIADSPKSEPISDEAWEAMLRKAQQLDTGTEGMQRK